MNCQLFIPPSILVLYQASWSAPQAMLFASPVVDLLVAWKTLLLEIFHLPVAHMVFLEILDLEIFHLPVVCAMLLEILDCSETETHAN